MLNMHYTKKQWEKIFSFLKKESNIYIGQESECRRFVEAVIWIARSGAQWRMLPAKYGRWNSVYKRFCRWQTQGVWQRMFAHFVQDPDLENLLIDSTMVRAHPCAAGALKKNGGQEQQALGRSRGGFSTKIHITVDALGNPLRFSLTPGQANDIVQAEAMIDGFNPEAVIADKGYDADRFVDQIRRNGCEVVIPPRNCRNEKREFDSFRYHERHLIECFVSKIKQFRRIFTRFEKLATRYLAFLHIVAVLIWLR